jgi:hypothetical protein
MHRSFSFRSSPIITGLRLMLLAALCAVPAASQISLKAGGGIGITSAVSSLNGTTMQYYDGSRYGQNSGMNLHGKVKVGLSGLDLVGEIGYSSLTNSGNSEPGQGKVDITQSILSVSFGPEIHLVLPLLPLVPYLGLNIASNTFSGETAFVGVSKVPSAVYSIQSATRIGAGMKLGAEVSIAPFVTLDLAASYNFMNIYGKEWADVNTASDQRIDSYLSLNDARDPLFIAGDDKHFINNDRNIHAMLFTVSILFGL